MRTTVILTLQVLVFLLSSIV